MNEAYRSARKAYGPVSGLLIAWELIGIELQSQPLADFNIVLKSPQAAPYILLVLLAYFAFHFTIEWHQSDHSRRELAASRVDFFVAQAIAILAVLLFTVQAVQRFQVFR